MIKNSENEQKKIKFKHKMVEFDFEPDVLIKYKLKKVLKYDWKLLDDKPEKPSV